MNMRNGFPLANSVGSGKRSHKMVVVLLLDPFAVEPAQWATLKNFISFSGCASVSAASRSYHQFCPKN